MINDLAMRTCSNAFVGMLGVRPNRATITVSAAEASHLHWTAPLKPYYPPRLSGSGIRLVTVTVPIFLAASARVSVTSCRLGGTPVPVWGSNGGNDALGFGVAKARPVVLVLWLPVGASGLDRLGSSGREH